MEYVIGGIIFAVIVVGLFLFGRSEKDGKGGKRNGGKRNTDPRDERFDQSAVRLRTIILTLADALHGMDSTVESTSGNLSEARIRISNIKSSHYGKEAEVLIDEIDNVINSNTTLRKKLSETQTTLDKQQEQILDLRTAVRIDALTQLGNRAAFEERMQEAIDRFKRYGDTFCLLMLDIDHFKKINDSYGHLSGDRVLKGLSVIMKQEIRSTDFAGRYGGEEFGIVLPKSALGDARDVGEKLRAAVDRSKFALDNVKLHVTVSIGISESREGDSTEDIIKRADDCLYKAKETGRNRVVVDGM